MSKKDDLRRQRAGTVINLTSKQQESDVGKALLLVIENIQREFGLALHHEREWKLATIVGRLKSLFPDVPFAEVLLKSSMKPDGGILSIEDNEGHYHPILIVEVKNQGTNDLRLLEGLKEQSKGNAIERLGKNVIGFRTALLHETISPFVCFGYGCDFAERSSIRDRVITIAMFGPLNETVVMNQGEHGQFNRGSFYFREEPWTSEEMVEIMAEVARRSTYYYFAKYGEDFFPRISTEKSD